MKECYSCAFSHILIVQLKNETGNVLTGPITSAICKAILNDIGLS